MTERSGVIMLKPGEDVKGWMTREEEIRHEAETKLHKMIMAHTNMEAKDVNLPAMFYEMFDIIFEVINIYDKELVYVGNTGENNA